MSGKNIKINERREGENKVSEDTLYIPREATENNKAIEANWRDDVEEMAEEENEAIGFEPYEEEKEYKSPLDENIHDPEEFRSREKFSEVISRARAQKVGRKVLRIAFGSLKTA